MKIVIISDTHGNHNQLGPLCGDVLIHCGDMENLFNRDDQALQKIDHWFGQQHFDHVLCTGGNHDLMLEAQVRAGHTPLFRNATFLNGTEITINGIKFFGAPWVPELERHAFYADDDMLRQAWSRIPQDVDVLVTHTPPAGMLDVSSGGASLGCVHLKDRLKAIRPKLHCFGHVHASSGMRKRKGVTFINASSVNSDFEIAVPPFEFEISTAPAKRGRNVWARLLGR